LSRPRSRPRLLSQDQDQDQDLCFCPRGASRPRPWSRGLHHCSTLNNSVHVLLVYAWQYCQMSQFRKLSYEKRLQVGLTTLKERRQRGDMTEVFKQPLVMLWEDTAESWLRWGLDLIPESSLSVSVWLTPGIVYQSLLFKQHLWILFKNVYDR